MAITNYDEVFYETNVNTLVGNSAVHYIFPPTDLYNDNGTVIEPYVATADDKITNADIAFLKLNAYTDPDQLAPASGIFTGDWEGTNVAGAFHALGVDDYFYKYDISIGDHYEPSLQRYTPWTPSTVEARSFLVGDKVLYDSEIYKCITAHSNSTTWAVNASKWELSTYPMVAEAIKLPINSSGATFENKSLGMATANVSRFDDIEVEGLDEGKKPFSMAATAIRLEGDVIEDVMYRCFADSTVTGASTTITSANLIKTWMNRDQGRTFAGIPNAFIDEPSNDLVIDTSKGGNTAYTYDSADYISAVEIVNIERSLDDDRYGDAEDDLPFIFTGASHYFTGTEVSGNEGVDIDVWGGDCFIGLHTFKVSDTTYALTNAKKLITNDATGNTTSTAEQKWGYYFDNGDAANDKKDISRPFPLKGVSQTVTVLLESEINPETTEKIAHNDYSYDEDSAVSSTNLPVPVVDSAGQIRSNFKYRFNLDYARQNDYKVFFPFQTYQKNNNEFGARIVYSDQKVYNTDIEGFDRFRVANFYDLDESHGSGSKLVEAADRIFALQESALSYIPISSQVIETTDGANLAVRNGEIIGIPNKIDVLYGTQHPKTVKTDGTTFFFTDALRGEVLMFDGQKVNRISNTGMEGYFDTNFSSLTTHSNLSAVYDNKSKEYLVFFRGTEGAVFNAEYGIWTSRFPETSVTNTLAGVRVGGTMMLGGIDEVKNVEVASLYTGTLHELWGTVHQSYFKYYVAPEPDQIKIFDGFTFNADYIPAPQTFTVTDNDGTNNLSVITDGTAPILSVEGNFRVKNFREVGTNRRSRGLVGEMLINLNASNQSGITSAYTKYRTSPRPI